MTPEEKYIVHILFKNKILTCDGKSFQDLFNQIMQYKEPDFRPVKPSGQIGDKKNDGYIDSTGVYYQVYAPEDLGKNTKSAMKKMRNDFERLYKNWDSITSVKKFYFVLNDKLKGASPELYQLSAILTKEFNVECSIYLAKDLENDFLKLNDEQRKVIIGNYPTSSSIEDIDYNSLTEVIHYILNRQMVYKTESIPKKPDFDEKIKFNKLSSIVANLLHIGSYQNYVVNDFFKVNSDFHKDELRNKFNQIYHEAIELIVESDIKNDEVFFYILNQTSPNNTLSYQSSVLILMSYYFEYCDIFETPKR